MRLPKKMRVNPEWEKREFFFDSAKTKIDTRYYVDARGKLQGPFEQYSESGILTFEVNFLDDKRHGVATLYDDHGVPALRGYYYHGNVVRQYGFDKEQQDWVLISPSTKKFI